MFFGLRWKFRDEKVKFPILKKLLVWSDWDGKIWSIKNQDPLGRKPVSRWVLTPVWELKTLGQIIRKVCLGEKFGEVFDSSPAAEMKRIEERKSRSEKDSYLFINTYGPPSMGGEWGMGKKPVLCVFVCVWGGVLSLCKLRKLHSVWPTDPQPGIPRPLEVQEGSCDGSMGYFKCLNLNWRYFCMTDYGVSGSGCCQTWKVAIPFLVRTKCFHFSLKSYSGCVWHTLYSLCLLSFLYYVILNL